MTELLILVGGIATFIIAWSASGKAKHYKKAYTEEEAEDFKKPFRYPFWLVITVFGLMFFLMFSYMAFEIGGGVETIKNFWGNIF